MTSPLDLAALRDRVLVHATELYCAGRDLDPETIVDELTERIVDDLSLPALLDRLERAERDSQRFRSQLERVVGVHNAPNDCYATGPMTGDEYLDLVSCPSCEAVAMLSAPNTPTPEQP